MPGRFFGDRCCGFETPVVLVIGAVLGMLARGIQSDRDLATAMQTLSAVNTERNKIGAELNATQGRLSAAQDELRAALARTPKCEPHEREIVLDVGGRTPRMGEAWRVLSGSIKIGR